jgi:DNA polymerase-3 subunit epsilon
MKHHISVEAIAALPDTPGVYLFYGPLKELLYVGKSKTIRTRVRSHFASPQERWLCRKVYRVEIEETAGELGARLLESRLIKELHPMFNVSSRQRRRIVIARRTMNAQGYIVVHLQAVDYLNLDEAQPILGVFKHKTQAREYLVDAARTYRLCPKLLRLEVARGHCFSYHLKQCDGACMGEEEPGQYNARVERAFDARRIQAWPYRGGVIVTEESRQGLTKEIFLIDNWCLLASFKSANGVTSQGSASQHRFDYDSYKILFAYLTDPKNEQAITVCSKERFDDILRDGYRSILPGSGTGPRS